MEHNNQRERKLFGQIRASMVGFLRTNDLARELSVHVNTIASLLELEQRARKIIEQIGRMIEMLHAR